MENDKVTQNKMATQNSCVGMENDKKARIYYANYMSMYESLAEAKDMTPKPEWMELKGYVKFRDFEVIQNELTDALKREQDLLEELRKIASYFDCLQCDGPGDYTCSHHLDERMELAEKAIQANKLARGM